MTHYTATALPQPSTQLTEAEIIDISNSGKIILLNREGGAYEAPEDSHEYENHGESSHYAWMIPCIYPSALCAFVTANLY